jgi:hypothetical protein
LLAVAVACAALTFGGGVAEALPLGADDIGSPLGGDDIGSPVDGIPIVGSPTDDLPIIGDGEGPKVCSVTVADPRRSRSCNDRGGDGWDGEDGSVSGHRTSRQGPADRYREDQQADIDDADELGPDVNGAPGRSGAPRPYVRPGSTP